MSKKILVTGSNGQLGYELRKLAPESKFDFIFTDIQDLNITDEKAVLSFFETVGIDWCINCAAYTAVDKAETDKEVATLVNETAVANLTASCEKTKARILHISTDFVFDGKHHLPYKEDQTTHPLNHYGFSKLMGEKALMNLTDKGIVIRTSWLYSVHGNNFPKTMIRLGKERPELNVIYDQVGTPTYAADLARTILLAIENNTSSGLYHYSNEGVASWYDFAVAVMKNERLNCRVNPIETHQYPTPAERPSFSVLHKGKIKDVLGIRIPHWQESLEIALKALQESHA